MTATGPTTTTNTTRITARYYAITPASGEADACSEGLAPPEGGMGEGEWDRPHRRKAPLRWESVSGQFAASMHHLFRASAHFGPGGSAVAAAISTIAAQSRCIEYW